MIESLADDDAARLRFLSSCSIHGTLLALSTEGGAQGSRRLPLLDRDADWDAVADRIHALVPEMEEIELTAVLDAIVRTRHELARTPDEAEVDAVARGALSRISAQWANRQAPVPLGALISWLALGASLTPRPSPPELGRTWADLLPVRAPDLSDQAAVDRFADWLMLAAALSRFEERATSAFNLKPDPPGFVKVFVNDINELDPDQWATNVVIGRALDHIGQLFPSFAEGSMILSRARVAEASAAMREPPLQQVIPSPGGHDIARVLRDL